MHSKTKPPSYSLSTILSHCWLFHSSS